MKTEENKRMLARSHNVDDSKPHRIKFMQRMHTLPDNHEEMVRKLEEKYKRIDEDPFAQSLLGMLNMREQRNRLKGRNRELCRIASVFCDFVKDKNIYMKKGTSCGYTQGYNTVCSTYCLECKSCLSVIEGLGVICANKLVEARVSFPNND